LNSTPTSPCRSSAAFHAVAAKRKLEIVSKQCLASVKQVMSHKWSFPFVKPVDAAALGLENYHEIVKRPMDLGTVRANIEKGGVYAACEEVHRDVELTFANAMLYNGARVRAVLCVGGDVLFFTHRTARAWFQHLIARVGGSLSTARFLNAHFRAARPSLPADGRPRHGGDVETVLGTSLARDPGEGGGGGREHDRGEGERGEEERGDARAADARGGGDALRRAHGGSGSGASWSHWSPYDRVGVVHVDP
jgi:hypothetical protein